MKILYVTPYVPSPIRTRPYNLIHALSRLGHAVTLLTAGDDDPAERAQLEEIKSWGVRTELFPVSRARSMFNCVQALFTAEPLQAVYAYHPAMEERLSSLLATEPFDVVHIEHLRAARLVHAVKGLPVVYDSVDCISMLFEQAAASGAQLRSRLLTRVDLGRTRSYEAWLMTAYDQVTVTSERDKKALEELGRSFLSPDASIAPISIITNGVDLAYFQPLGHRIERDGQTVIFSGKMSYHANVTAALYFARKVLPLIWLRYPDVRFVIVGKDPPDAIRRLGTESRIKITGTVPDLRPYLARAAVAVCPAPYAVGVQNKVLEAMAMGTPVVSTPAGCAALAAKPGRDLLVADGERALADATLEVLHDPRLRKELSKSGRAYAEAHHGWETAAEKLTLVYERAQGLNG